MNVLKLNEVNKDKSFIESKFVEILKENDFIDLEIEGIKKEVLFFCKKSGNDYIKTLHALSILMSVNNK